MVVRERRSVLVGVGLSQHQLFDILRRSLMVAWADLLLHVLDHP